MERIIAIVIRVSEEIALKKIVVEISHGIEEEGLPCLVELVASTDSYSMALAASSQSDLDVGIGVSNDGTIGVHQAKLPDDLLLFREKYQHVDLRAYGANAARLIKGIPFKAYK